MSNDQPTADMTLSDFLILHYMPSMHNRLKREPQPASLQRIRRVCKQLTLVIGRKPLVRDLTVENFRALGQFLKTERLASAKYLQDQQRYYLAIWRCAAGWHLVPIDAEHASNKDHMANLGPDGKKIELSDAPGTLWQICQDSYFPKNIRIRSEETKRQYHCALRDFKEYLGHDPTIADLKEDEVTGMMQLMQHKGKSAYTINERRGRVCALWTWLAKRRLVPDFPTIQSLHEPKRIPKAMTKEELTRLIESCRHVGGRAQRNGRATKIWCADWWVALHLALWDSGERISAMLAIRWEWLAESGRLDIPAEVRKGRERDMTYQLHPETMKALAKIRLPDEPTIFAWAYQESNMYIKYKKIRQAAGLPTGHRYGFHQMRRSVASHLQAAGHDASIVLQHASPAITRESYLDPGICANVQPSKVLFRIEPEDETESLAWL